VRIRYLPKPPDTFHLPSIASTCSSMDPACQSAPLHSRRHSALLGQGDGVIAHELMRQGCRDIVRIGRDLRDVGVSPKAIDLLTVSRLVHRGANRTPLHRDSARTPSEGVHVERSSVHRDSARAPLQGALHRGAIDGHARRPHSRGISLAPNPQVAQGPSGRIAECAYRAKAVVHTRPVSGDPHIYPSIATAEAAATARSADEPKP
jgi:hypothetical protein